MHKKVLRYCNLAGTGLLILLPSLYYLYGINGLATVSWAPAIIFWVFLVIHRLHGNLEELLFTKRIEYTPEAVAEHSSTQKMRERRGF